MKDQNLSYALRGRHVEISAIEKVFVPSFGSGRSVLATRSIKYVKDLEVYCCSVGGRYSLDSLAIWMTSTSFCFLSTNTDSCLLCSGVLFFRKNAYLVCFS
jgi:hypothetical protein